MPETKKFERTFGQKLAWTAGRLALIGLVAFAAGAAFVETGHGFFQSPAE